MFEPKHLTTDQIRELYRQILTQSEEAELVAHANYVRAQAARVAAERDLDRLTPRPCEG